MPSDTTTDGRAALALEALDTARELYHSALVATFEELRGLLESASPTAEAKARRTAAELGAFAVGRIDIERFAAFQHIGEPVAVGEMPRVEAAARTLRSLLERGEEGYRMRVEPGADLRDAVLAGLSRLGRAFGAARTVELARAGRYEEGTHDGWLEEFPPALWNSRERSIAPPLVVEVHGADLRVGGLADLLDGVQKLVLVVHGDAPPAALARLITPGVAVVQTDDPADLAVLEDADGPGIAALVEGDAARFAHVPAADGARGRLTIHRMPEEEPRRAIGTISAKQQSDGLRHLASLAAGWGLGAEPPAAPVDGDVGSSAGAADTLAAWILRQANLGKTG